jgi:hypothetical protein
LQHKKTARKNNNAQHHTKQTGVKQTAFKHEFTLLKRK